MSSSQAIVHRVLLPAFQGRIVCVDLDGTLIVGDLLWESFIKLCKRSPVRAIRALLSLRHGKARFKSVVAGAVDLDPATLTYRQPLLDQLRHLHHQGVTLVLATASDERYARLVAAHLGIFADVVASDGRRNLSGEEKAAELTSRYGKGKFEYIGNGWVDRPVWHAAGGGVVVAAPSRLVAQVRASGLVNDIRDARPPGLVALARALRPHQWTKNLLVFVPVAAAHQILQPQLIGASIVAFAVFSLGASAIYILNDIVDLEADRQHPRKRHRPFAAGDLSVPAGVLWATLLLVVAITTAASASWPLTIMLLVYVATTSAYSLYLKRQPVADVFTLTALYLLRIVAGGVATGTPLSSWLLAFGLFLFLSLAFVKRYTELLTTTGWVAGRGYCRNDSAWVQAIGTSAGYMAVVVLALYVNAPEVSALYRRAAVLWLLCPTLLYWLTRLWFRASRGLVHDDPIFDALTDPASHVTAAVAASIVVAAI